MNIEYANSLPMREILSKTGLHPVQENSILSLYPSPFFKNAPLSLHVNAEQNKWSDSELLADGGPVEFVRLYLKRLHLRCSVVDALDWLKANIGYPSLLHSISLPDYELKDYQYTFSYKSVLNTNTLISYLEGRHIPVKLARSLLKEVAFINSTNGREYIALGLKTDMGGYAVRSPFIKAIVGPQSISVIRARLKKDSVEKRKSIHFFKDVFDYLSAVLIQKGKPFNNDVIILNSYSCLEQSGRFIRDQGYSKVYTWFDNGEIGQQATKNFAILCNTQNDMWHEPQNKLYASGHDVNVWLVKEAQKLGL